MEDSAPSSTPPESASPLVTGTETVRSLPKVVGSLVLFGLSFAITLKLLSVVTEGASSSIMVAKVGEFTKDPEGFDGLFIGNSHVYREVDPEAFDERMNEHGFPVRTYNFGGRAMMYTEIEHTLRQIRDSRPDRLKWVFVDLSFGWNPEEQLGTARSQGWHDFRATWVSSRLVLQSKQPGAIKFQRLKRHWTDFLSHVTHKGLLVPALEALILGRRDDSPLAGHTRGFEPLERRASTEGRADHFHKQMPQYLSSVWRLAKVDPVIVPHVAHREACLVRLMQIIREMGAEPVFYLGPVVHYEVRFLDTEKHPTLYPLFTFNIPKRYGALYRAQMRFDAGHLNKVGARLFSQGFADEFVRALKAESGK